MKVILLKDVSNLGRKGDIVNAADGFARNFLFPKGLAEPVTEGRMQEIARNADARARKEKRLDEQARALAARLKGLTVKVAVRTGEGGRLFGSVSTKDIAAALEAQHKINIDRKKFELKEPIKSLGTYKVLARLHPGVHAEFTVEVTGV
ncbi:MAG: 50S ribosomal protein L9 [Bacillota bacterium]